MNDPMTQAQLARVTEQGEQIENLKQENAELAAVADAVKTLVDFAAKGSPLDLRDLRSDLDHLRLDLDDVLSERESDRSDLDDLRSDLDDLRDEFNAVRDDLDKVRSALRDAAAELASI